MLLLTPCARMLQGRRFWLAYVLYYNESYGAIQGALSMAKALLPTDILVNVGVWLHWSKPSCEQPGAAGSDQDGTACPAMPYMCEEFATARQKGSSYRLWWNTPVPSYKQGNLTEVLGKGHHLNVRERCSLGDDQVCLCFLNDLSCVVWGSLGCASQLRFAYMRAWSNALVCFVHAYLRLLAPSSWPLGQSVTKL
jgi:hypothetical protein